MASVFRTIRQNARLMIGRLLHELREEAGQSPQAARTPPDVSALETRLLMSASPAVQAADLFQPAGAEAAGQTTIAIADQRSPESVDTSAAGGISVNEQQDGLLVSESASASGAVSAQSQNSGRELVVIDTAADGWQQLLQDIERQSSRSFDILILDPQRDGIEQITDRLRGMSDVSAVHLVSHGDDGEILLGAGVLSRRSLETYAAELVQWQQSMTADADVLIYGCNLAATDDGRALAEALNVLLAADVAASDDLTGHAEFGGDWQLELTIGDVSTDVAFSQDLQASWHFVLATDAVLFSTTGDVSGSGVAGLDSWQNGSVLQLADPSLSLGAGPTDGTVSLVAAFNALADDGDVDINAVHVVSQNITVGSGANQKLLEAGDILFSTAVTEYFDGGNVVLNPQDVGLFEPTSPGDLSSGTFSVLLDELSPPSIIGQNVLGITLVEQATTIGDRGVNAGDFLFTQLNPFATNDVFLFETTGVGSGTTSGTVSELVEGDDLGLSVLSSFLLGIDLIETSTTVGMEPLNAGTILLTSTGTQTVGSTGLSTTANDIFALELTSTTLISGTANGTATMFLRGSDLGLDTSQETLDAVAVSTSFTSNTAPTADAGGPYVIAEGDALVLDASGSFDAEDALTYLWDLDNDGAFDDAAGVNPTVAWTALPVAIRDDGSYSIAVRVDDGVNAAVTASTTVTVTDTAPVLSVSGTAATTAGAAYRLNLSAFDPGDDTIAGWTIQWGDGTIQTVAGNPASVTHTYTVDGLTANVLVSAQNEDGTFFQNDLVVPDFLGDRIYRFDAVTGAYLQQFGGSEGIQDPVSVIVGPDGNLYVGSERSKDVLRYDGQTGAFIDAFVPAGTAGLQNAEGIVFGRDGHLYVADYSGSRIMRFDGVTGAYIDDFVASGAGGLNTPYALVFGPDGDLYVNSYTGDGVYRYDGTTGAFIDQFVASGSGGLDQPEQMAFGPDGHLYISSSRGGSVLKFDGATGAFLSEVVATGSGGLTKPGGLAFGPDGLLYVGDLQDGEVLRYDPISGSFIDQYVPAGTAGLSQPALMSFVPDHQVRVLPNSISEVAAAPGIDGVVDALWSTEPGRSLQHVNVGSVDDAADLSGQWKAVWDAGNLYLLVEVTDDTLVRDSGQASDDDLVEIYIDADNSKGPGYDGVNDFEYGFRYNDPVVVYVGSNSVNDSTGVTFSMNATASGYVLEVAVPWTTLGVVPANLNAIGVDVHVTDDDDGGSRDAKMAWNDSQDQAFQDAGAFGTATLAALPSAPGDHLNEYTTDDQVVPDVAMDAAGNYVVVWQTLNQDGAGWEVYARRYNADGTPASGEFRVNQTTVSDQTEPRVAMDNAGNFVVVWTSAGQGADGPAETNIYARVFSGVGADISGGEFLVNDVQTGRQETPAVAMDGATGDFTIAWAGLDPVNGDWDIFKRQFSLDGTPEQSQVRVNSTIAGDQKDPDVGVSSYNEYTIVWTGYGQDGDAPTEGNIYLQNYRANGGTRGGEILGNRDTTAGHQHSAAVAVEADGDYDIVWVSDGQDGDGAGVYADQIAFGGSGNNRMGEFLVNETTAGEQRRPDVSLEPQGNLVFTWESTGQDGDSAAETNVYTRLFNVTNSNITPMAGEFLVNQTASGGSQGFAAVAADGDDDFVIVWSGPGTGDASGVYGRVFFDQLTNLAPSVSLANSSITYSEGNPPLVIDSGLTVSDPDDAVLQSATVSFRSGFAGPEDVLSFTPVAGVVGSYDSATGVLAFTGTATVADYETLLRSVGYENTSGSPDTTVREIEFRVNDATTSGSDARSVNVVDVNGPPTVDAGQSFSVTDGAANGTAVGTLSASDGDTGTVFSNWTIVSGNEDGVFELDAVTGALRVLDNSSLNSAVKGRYLLSVTVSDGTSTSTPQLVEIVVLRPAAPPQAQDDTFSINEGATLTQPVLSDWWNASWKARQQIVFDNSSSATDLTDYAVRLQLHASDPGSITVDYGKIQAGGADLRFVDSGGQLLNHEIESWDAAGYSYVWVEVPRISAGSTADAVWMYFDHGNVGDGQNTPSVWNPDDVAVFHMDGNLVDSSQYLNYGGQSGVITAAGVTGDAGDWDGSSSFAILPATEVLDNVFAGGGTISAWINADTWGENGYGRIADKASSTFGGGSNGDGWAFQVATGGRLIFEHGFTGGHGGWRTSLGSLTTGAWHHVAVVYDSSSAASDPVLYIDGVQQTVTEFRMPAGTARSDAGISMVVGNHAQSTSRTFDGRIDEFRVSTSAKSADEIAADVAAVAGSLISGGAVQFGPGSVLQNDFDVNGDALTVSLVSGPSFAASFSLNADGSFAYEHDGSENFLDSFVYRVSDGATSSDATVTLNITPLNDHSPVVTSGQSFSVAENSASGTLVGQLTATDADSGSTLSGWSIVGGNGSGIFGIDSATGDLSVIDGSQLDYETTVAYSLQVSVSDGVNVSAPETVLVTISPVNEYAPVFTSPGAVSVAENQTDILTVSATDGDLPAQAVSYSIVGGVDASRLVLAGTQLQFVSGADFESPSDADGNNVYEVVLRADDGNGLFVDQPVQVTVTDVNDHSPVVTPGQSFSVAENSASGTFAGQLTATDADSGSTLSGWSIVSGNTDGIFGIDSVTGRLIVADPAQLDYEAVQAYSLTVRVSDGTNVSSDEVVAISIVDVDERPRVSTISDQVIDEDQPAGPIALTVTDPDTNVDALTITVTSDDQSLVRDSDILVSGSGTTRSLSFQPVENAFGGPVTLTVSVSDGTFTAQTSFEVTVRPVNDNPVFNGPPIVTLQLSGPSVQVPAPGLLAGAFDADGDPLTVVVLQAPANGTLVVGPAGGFRYEANSGFSGTDSFTYLVTDGHHAGPDQQVILQVPVVVAPSGAGTQQTSGNSGGLTDNAATVPSVQQQANEFIATEFPIAATPVQPAGTVSSSADSDEVAPPPNTDSDDDDTGFFVKTTATVSAESVNRESFVVAVTMTDRVSASQFDESSSDAEIASRARSAEMFVIEEDLQATGFQYSFDRYAELRGTIDGAAAFQDELEDEFSLSEMTRRSVAVASTSIVVGTVFTVLRGGMLALGLLSQLPVWTMFDPLMVIDGVSGDDGDSLEEIVDRQRDRTDRKLKAKKD